jgi:hypothetical protein
MIVSPFSYLLCMKASRDGLALYTMQNRKESGLFRGRTENISLKNGNKNERWVSGSIEVAVVSWDEG